MANNDRERRAGIEYLIKVIKKPKLSAVLTVRGSLVRTVDEVMQRMRSGGR